MHFTRLGRGPTLLLLHGIGASTFVWRENVGALSKHFTTICVDLAGFGYSDKKETDPYTLEWQVSLIRGLIERLKIEKFGLIGSSMGGVIALRIAELLPDQVNGLALIAPAVYTPAAQLGWKHLQHIVPASGSLIHPFVRPETMRMILNWVLRPQSPLQAEVVEEYLSPLRQGGESFTSFLKSFQALEDAHRIQKYNIPESLSPLVLWGEDDRVLPITYSKKIDKIIPHAQVVRVPRGGHHPMETCPEFVNQHLVSYFLSCM